MAEHHQEVLVALRRIMRATELYSKQLSRIAGLTAPQLLIMQAIHDSGDVTIGTIARAASLSQATVTTILDRLEKRGFVYRERSTVDKRKVHAHLTEAGAAALEAAPTPLQQSFVERFQVLQEWEQTLITSSLQRIADMMDAGEIEASPVLHVGLIDHHPEANDERYRPDPFPADAPSAPDANIAGGGPLKVSQDSDEFPPAP
ncbi:MAG TPA: MarR family transcriptional regulator [Pseudomonadales bacterium]|nr:MarR family transcriptional regulator [Pseudomonadales bacterium]